MLRTLAFALAAAAMGAASSAPAAEPLLAGLGEAWHTGGFKGLSGTPFPYDSPTPFPPPGAVGGITLDASTFSGRLGVYRLLMERTAALCGPLAGGESPSVDLGAMAEGLPEEHAEGLAFHFLWGYVAQLCWQHASGRLAFPGEASAAGANPDAIHPDSWWGAMNYGLCVVPALGAQKAGVLEADVLFTGCPALLVPALAPAVDAWAAAWSALAAAHASPLPSTPAEAAAAADALRACVWDAHVASLACALPLHGPMLARLPPRERAFGRGWCAFVDVLACGRLRTDLEAIATYGAGFLPHAVLAPGARGEGLLPRYLSSSAAGPAPPRGAVRRSAARVDRAVGTVVGFTAEGALAGVLRRCCRTLHGRRSLPGILRATALQAFAPAALLALLRLFVASFFVRADDGGASAAVRVPVPPAEGGKRGRGARGDPPGEEPAVDPEGAAAG